MENASKALLIAAEVFVGLIVLSIFAFTFRRIYLFAESYQETAERQKIIAFNTQYTKYITNTTDNMYIYAEDVVTLTEKVINWNRSAVIENEEIELNIFYQNGALAYSTKRNIEYEFDRKTFLVRHKLKGDANQNGKEYKFSCQAEENFESGRIKRVIIKVEGVRD